MEISINHPEYGLVEVRNAIFDVDGTNLQEGIEIKFIASHYLPIIEKYGYFDLYELTRDEVIEMIDDHIDFEQHFN